MHIKKFSIKVSKEIIEEINFFRHINAMNYSYFSQMFIMNIMNNKIFAHNLQKCHDGKLHFTIWKHTQMDEKKNVIPYEMCLNGLKEVMYLMAQNFGLVVLLVGPTKTEYEVHKIRDFKFFILFGTYKVSNKIIFADYSAKLGCVHAYSFGETVSFMDIDLTDGMSIEDILYLQYSAKADAEAEEEVDEETDDAEADADDADDEEVNTELSNNEESTSASHQSAFNKARQRQKWHDVSSTETGSDESDNESDESDNYTAETVNRLLIEDYHQKVISETLGVSRDSKDFISEILRISQDKSLTREEQITLVLTQMNRYVS